MQWHDSFDSRPLFDLENILAPAFFGIWPLGLASIFGRLKPVMPPESVQVQVPVGVGVVLELEFAPLVPLALELVCHPLKL